MAAVDAELRAIHATLRALGHPDIDAPLWSLEGPDAVLWLRCAELTQAIDDASRTRQQSELEALLLLARLAQVDWERCRKHILKIWKDGVRQPEYLTTMEDSTVTYTSSVAYVVRLRELLKQRRFKIGVDVLFANANSRSSITDLCVLCDAIIIQGFFQEPSYQYRRLCGRIDALATSPTQLPAYVPVRLVQYEADERTNVQSILSQVLQVALTQDYFVRQPKASETPWLRIDCLVLNHSARAITESALHYVFALHGCGISGFHLPVLNALPPPATLQAVLATSDRHTTDAKGATNMQVSTGLERQQITSYFSAMYASQSLREVCLRSSHDDSDPSYWAWFALAVMKGRAPIQRLELSASCLRADGMEHLRRALNRTNLLAHLVSPGSTEPEHALALVTAGTFCLDANASNTMTLNVPHRDLPMVHRSGCWLRVLLPGWGPAWVHEDAAIIQDQPASPLVCAPRKSVSEITLRNVTDDTMSPTIEFLERVGRDIRHLHLWTVVGNAPMDRWFERLFLSCTRLEELTLKNLDLTSTTFLVDCYAASVCKIKRLTMYGIENQDETRFEFRTETLLPILSALCDPKHAITKCLDHVTFTSLATHLPITSRVLDKVLEMFALNARLRSLNLSFPHLDLPLDDRKRYAAEFSAVDGTPIAWLRQGPLALRKKLAFLSVVATDRAPVRYLDSGVVSKVFVFAAKCEQRRVSFTI